jgi:surface carbohydrate biosynthesis protein (TIGR04326 family)
MNILVIIDDGVDLRRFDKLFKTPDMVVTLFPLTSNFLVIEKIRQHLLHYSNLTINIVDSAALINEEVNVMRQTIHKWSYQLGETRINNKNLKEWFLFPDQGGSSWWLSLLAEKNSVQDVAFFKIAQINAIEKFYQQHQYGACTLGLADKRQAAIIKKIMARATPIIKSLRCISSVKKSVKHKILDFINNSGLIGALISSAMYWVIWLKDSRTARKNLLPLSQRVKPDNSFLFITYFPNLDEEKAKQGVFRNKYALPLQDKLDELNIPVTWLTMPVYYNGHNFSSAMRLAKKISTHGESLLVLQEFFSLKVFCKAFIWWLRQSLLSFTLLWRLKKNNLVANLTSPAAYPILKYLWWHSFVGSSGTRGIIFYLTYLEVFKALPRINTCLYYCEMQAWEKAMLLAKKKQQTNVKTIAFQHTSVMENFFNYFYHNDEIKQANLPTDFPMPDQLLANGNMMHTLLAKTNWPSLSQAEAIRHMYISHLKIADTLIPGKNVLLVVGSYDRVETKSLITLVYQAFPIAVDFEIWFKGSPVNPVEPLLAQLGIDAQKANYKICHAPVAELLPQVSIALVANTTVSIEALALGRELIIPLFADTMMMNPAVNSGLDYKLVSHPQQLQACVTSILQNYQAPETLKGSDFIQNYWHLDAAIPRWTEILNSICPQSP